MFRLMHLKTKYVRYYFHFKFVLCSLNLRPRGLADFDLKKVVNISADVSKRRILKENMRHEY